MANGNVEVIDRLIELDRTSPKRILIVGDSMTDTYVYGRSGGECQEGCFKFVEELRVLVPGGAANALRSLDHWNARKMLFGGGIKPIKTRFMVGDECVFRYDDDSSDFDMRVVRYEAMEILKDWKPDAVLLSDYDKGVLTPDFVKEVVSVCASRSVPCVADCKREPEVYEGAVIKGNSDYFKKYAERARKVNSQAVTTHGCYPPTVWDRGKITVIEVGKQVECVNHVGAGDCFAAHLTLALAYGFDLHVAASVAHSAGRVYVQRRNNCPPMPCEIRTSMV